MSEFEQVIKEGAQSLGKRFRRFLLILLGLGIAILIGYFVVCNFTYSKGSRAGILVKVTYKGYLLKTYEGTLNTGGLTLGTNGGAISNSWDFSVLDRKVYEKLDNLQGTRVKLYYRQKVKAMPWQGATDYFVYQVESIK